MIRRQTWSALTMLSMLLLGLVAVACGGSASPGKAAEATQAPAVANLIVSADIVEGSKNVPKDQTAVRSCVLSSRYPRNSEMVFRARVYDPKTGDLMDDSSLSGLRIQLANGNNVDMKYGPHPKNPPNEFYWTGSWVVPKDAPTGTLNFTIVATAKDGRTGQYKPFSVQASLPAITDDVLPDTAAQ